MSRLRKGDRVKLSDRKYWKETFGNIDMNKVYTVIDIYEETQFVFCKDTERTGYLAPMDKFRKVL